MKRIYTVTNKQSDENVCFAVVANRSKDVHKYVCNDMFDELWFENWRDMVTNMQVIWERGVDVSSLDLWLIDTRTWLLLGVYYHAEDLSCDVCWKWVYIYKHETKEMVVCSDHTDY